MDFLVDTLGRSRSDQEPLRKLASDPESLDQLLDSPELFHRLLEAPHLLHVSPYFFYYVVVRQTFLERGIEDASVADYVGALLSYHLQQRPNRPRDSGGVYLIDLVQASSEARTPSDAFVLNTQIGNVALFLSGVFPDWIHYRHTYGRRSVKLEYYEQMGSRAFGTASRASEADRYDLGEVLEYMAHRFASLRQALNDLVDEHLHLAPRPATVEALCRQALYRVRN